MADDIARRFNRFWGGSPEPADQAPPDVPPPADAGGAAEPDFERRAAHQARLGSQARPGAARHRPEGVNPLTDDTYYAWHAFKGGGGGLLLIRRGRKVGSLGFGQVMEIEPEGPGLLVMTCMHAVITIEGRDLDAFAVDFWGGQAEFLQEFDPDRHVMPPAGQPVVSRILRHPFERYSTDERTSSHGASKANN